MGRTGAALTQAPPPTPLRPTSCRWAQERSPRVCNGMRWNIVSPDLKPRNHGRPTRCGRAEPEHVHARRRQTRGRVGDVRPGKDCSEPTRPPALGSVRKDRRATEGKLRAPPAAAEGTPGRRRWTRPTRVPFRSGSSVRFQFLSPGSGRQTQSPRRRPSLVRVGGTRGNATAFWRRLLRWWQKPLLAQLLASGNRCSGNNPVSPGGGRRGCREQNPGLRGAAGCADLGAFAQGALARATGLPRRADQDDDLVDCSVPRGPQLGHTRAPTRPGAAPALWPASLPPRSVVRVSRGGDTGPAARTWELRPHLQAPCCRPQSPRSFLLRHPSSPSWENSLPFCFTHFPQTVSSARKGGRQSRSESSRTPTGSLLPTTAPAPGLSSVAPPPRRAAPCRSQQCCPRAPKQQTPAVGAQVTGRWAGAGWGASQSTGQTSNGAQTACGHFHQRKWAPLSSDPESALGPSPWTPDASPRLIRGAGGEVKAGSRWNCCPSRRAQDPEAATPWARHTGKRKSWPKT